jgi:hypothetical protein
MIDDRRHYLKSKFKMFDALNIGYKSNPQGEYMTCVICKWAIHKVIEPYVQAGAYHYHEVCYKISSTR